MYNQILSSIQKLSYATRLFISFIICILLLYGPRFGVVDTSVLFSIIFGFPYIVIFFKQRRSFSFNEKFFIYLVIYSFALFFLEGFRDFSHNGHYFFRIIRSSFIYLSFHSISSILNIKANDLFKTLLTVLGIHLLIVYCQYFTDGVTKDFFLHLNTLFTPEMNPSEHEKMVMSGIRVRGLMKGFDSAGIMIALMAHFSLYYIRNNFIKVLLLVLTFIGTLITSRVGLVTFICVMFLYLPYVYITQGIKKFTIQATLCLAIFTSSVMIIHSFFPNSQLYQKSFGRAFHTYYTYVNSNKLEATSVSDTFVNHLTLKNIDSKRILLIGKASKQEPMTSNDPRSLNKLTSDVGYIQILYNFGIMNLLLFILIHFKLINALKILRNKDSYQFIALILTILFITIKGPYFFSRSVYDFIILAFFYENVMRQQYYKSRNNVSAKQPSENG